MNKDDVKKSQIKYKIQYIDNAVENKQISLEIKCETNEYEPEPFVEYKYTCDCVRRGVWALDDDRCSEHGNDEYNIFSTNNRVYSFRTLDEAITKLENIKNQIFEKWTRQKEEKNKIKDKIEGVFNYEF